jgi:hypothetical protein
MNKMVEKIEIIVKDKTIVNVGEESFNLGNVESVSMGKAFSLKEEGKTEIDFIYDTRGDLDESWGELSMLTKEVRGDKYLFSFKRSEKVDNSFGYAITIENRRYTPVVSIE